MNNDNNGLPLSKKGSANAYSMAGPIAVPEDGKGRKQCTAIVPKQYGSPTEHRCPFMAILGDTLCGTHRKAANFRELRSTGTLDINEARAKEVLNSVKFGELFTLIVEVCKQLPADNSARMAALQYLRQHGVARDVVDEILERDWKNQLAQDIANTTVTVSGGAGLADVPIKPSGSVAD